MGTYAMTRITPSKDVEGVIDIFDKYEARDCYKRFCEPTKWYADQLVNELMKKFPKVMFEVTEVSSSFFERCYAYQGQKVYESFLGPRFPSVAKFKKALVQQEEYDKKIQEKRRVEAAERKKKELERKQAEAKKIQEELAEMNKAL